MAQKLVTTFTILILVLLMIAVLMLVSTFTANLPDPVSQSEAAAITQAALRLVI